MAANTHPYPKPYSVTRNGKVYWYHKKGKGARRITSAPGTRDFDSEYRRYHDEERKVRRKENISGLCSEYRNDVAWRNLSESTRKQRQWWLIRIEEAFGDRPVSDFEHPSSKGAIRNWRANWKDSHRSADAAIQALSCLLSFAVLNGKIEKHHCSKLDRLYNSDRSEIIWSDDEISALRKVASPEIMHCVDLARMTGLRRGDLLNLRWSNIQNGRLRIQTGKSKGRKTASIPLYPELKELLSSIPKISEFVLTNKRGTGWSGNGFGCSWNKAIKKSGISDRHFHDLRGTAATKFLRAGMRIADVASILTWSERDVGKIASRYIGEDARAEAMAQVMQQAMSPANDIRSPDTSQKKSEVA